MANHRREFNNDNKYGVVGINLLGALLILATIMVAASMTTTLRGGLNQTGSVISALR